MSSKLYIRTFGCQMNEYDSDKMADVLHASDGLELTPSPEDADVILFNTCSVREKAQERVFDDLGRVRKLKAANPDLIIGVGGCVASQEGAAIVKRAPYVDVVFGPQTLHRLPELIARRRETGKAQVDISFPEIEKFDHLPPARVEGVAAFVSIMEGCSKYCSFCVVPYTRGEEVSRPFDDVLTEVSDLVDQGVKELTLLGQNVNAYRGRTGTGNAVADLATLIEYLAEIDGLTRIRYTTSHPKEMTQRLIDVYGKVPKLASHLHLPVQSGSDRVLAAMKRGYTALEYKSIVRRLRAVRPAAFAVVRFHRRLSRGDRSGFRADDASDRRRGVRRQLQLSLQRETGNAGRRVRRQRSARHRSGQTGSSAGVARWTVPRAQRADGGNRAARAGHRQCDQEIR